MLKAAGTAMLPSPPVPPQETMWVWFALRTEPETEAAAAVASMGCQIAGCRTCCESAHRGSPSSSAAAARRGRRRRGRGWQRRWQPCKGGSRTRRRNATGPDIVSTSSATAPSSPAASNPCGTRGARRLARGVDHVGQRAILAAAAARRDARSALVQRRRRPFPHRGAVRPAHSWRRQLQKAAPSAHGGVAPLAVVARDGGGRVQVMRRPTAAMLAGAGEA